jgi:hypothetical protein
MREAEAESVHSSNPPAEPTMRLRLKMGGYCEGKNDQSPGEEPHRVIHHWTLGFLFMNLL